MPTPETGTTIHTGAVGSWSEAGSLIHGEMDQVRGRISEQLITPFGSVNRLLLDTAAGAGKMLRPALVLLSGRCFGMLSDRHITLATMAELIHTASLLHDDVLDQATTRRNTPTANTLHGNEAAVLLGDYLLSRVFSLGMEFDDVEIGRVFSATAMALCQGELLQNLQRQNWLLDETMYLEIIRGKTAELFGSCCYLGAYAAGADKARIDSLREYGIRLGLAFQITDDLLDFTGREEAVGKTLGTDLAKRKPTLPVIHAVSTATDGVRRQLLGHLNDGADRGRIVAMLKECGSVDYAAEKARQYCREAVGCLSFPTEGPAKTALVRLAEAIVGRTG
jgi:octaprenyl-diphosphate synthase